MKKITVNLICCIGLIVVALSQYFNLLGVGVVPFWGVVGAYIVFSAMLVLNVTPILDGAYDTEAREE